MMHLEDTQVLMFMTGESKCVSLYSKTDTREVLLNEVEPAGMAFYFFFWVFDKVASFCSNNSILASCPLI